LHAVSNSQGNSGIPATDRLGASRQSDLALFGVPQVYS